MLLTLTLTLTIGGLLRGAGGAHCGAMGRRPRRPLDPWYEANWPQFPPLRTTVKEILQVEHAPYLPYISPISPLYLPYICPISRRPLDARLHEEP